MHRSCAEQPTGQAAANPADQNGDKIGKSDRDRRDDHGAGPEYQATVPLTWRDKWHSPQPTSATAVENRV